MKPKECRILIALHSVFQNRQEEYGRLKEAGIRIHISPYIHGVAMPRGFLDSYMRFCPIADYTFVVSSRCSVLMRVSLELEPSKLDEYVKRVEAELEQEGFSGVEFTVQKPD